MFVPHEYQKKPKHVQQIWIDLKLVKQWNEVKIEDRQGISFIIGKPNPQVRTLHVEIYDNFQKFNNSIKFTLKTVIFPVSIFLG
jgi:hypothetical protein